ncbi:lipoprotein LprA [Gordonia malaquae]|uniref:Lipoprotein n=1 Tax=Gordonia malaquae NBRC 108250 TaxID=1223542 RepID=M3VFG0_GORML|nr:LppX_LprAFG lipoprotein [Gordonia malaquae]GAC80069.1 hypothetical protein GM1_014_00620 [Gordonia malaquae NBRC 108250]SEC35744.1 lipoprotein LprA [Gordonia malaquae]
MNRSYRLVAGAFAGVVAASVILTGCSSSDDSGSSSTTAASDSAAKSTLDAAATATEALTGAHIVLSIDGKLQSLNATKVEADVETKPELKGKGRTTLNMGNRTTEAPFVYIDGKLYADVADKGYQDYGDGRSIYDVSKILDSKNGVPAILRALQGANKAGTETVNGVETTKITGTVSGKDLAGLASTPSTGELAEATYDATVFVTNDGKNNVARVVVSPAKDATLTVDISKWGQKVDVTKPKNVEAPTAKPKSTTSGETPREKTGS